MGKIMLEVKDLKTKYITRFHEDVYSVDGVSFTIEEGKSLGVAGESGCGKSTLALSVLGYYFPPLHYRSGDIIIDGKNISGMDPDTVRRTILGTEIAYIPQAAMNALNPTMKIIRFIEDVIRVHEPNANKKEIRERADSQTAGYTPVGLNISQKSGIPAGCDRDDIVCQENVKRFLIILIFVIAAVRIRTQGTAEADIDSSDLRLSRCFILFL